jgi:SAM-dependent methyltransferase
MSLLFWKVKLYLFCEQMAVIRRYYRFPRFAWIDFLLGAFYLFSNPFSICRRFCQRKGEDEVHTYGETPLTTWEQIAKKAGIGPEDVLLDLGCGRGRICFWSASVLGCRAIGVDRVPRFIRTARLFDSKRVRFVCSEIEDAPFEEATIVYYYALFHTHPLGKLPDGMRVLSVSEPLFPDADSLGSFSFPWGEGEVFLNRVSKQ